MGPPQEYDRMLRVNELLKRELGQLCERHVTPRLNSLLTVTGVSATVDLHRATVSISIMGCSEDQEYALEVCREYRRYFQKQLAKNVRLKYTPVLRFELDDTPQKADEVLGIIDEIENESTTESSEEDSDHSEDTE